jgi:hypothetical protein
MSLLLFVRSSKADIEFSPQRAAACDENAEILIWRAVAILDTMYQSIDANVPIPSHLLNGMVQFEQCANILNLFVLCLICFLR